MTALAEQAVPGSGRAPRPPTVHRVAVVTGGASGLGRVIAEHLAATGHDVAVCDLVDPTDTVAAVQGHGRQALGVIADASDPVAVTDFVRTVRERLGPVGVLVNNVGISPYTPFLDMSLEEWQLVVRVNLDSVFLLSQALLPDMIAAGAGRIICLSSSVVWDPLSTRMCHYATSKGGVWAFVRALAGEVGAHGVTVNALAPGLIATPVLRDRLPGEHWTAVAERQAVHRTLVPADLLPAVDFLVSDGAGATTGTTIPVNGGRVWM